jgi:hypothetical protein
MDDSQKILGKNIASTLKQLQKDKTLVNMHILGKDYESLTIVTGVRAKKSPPLFRIDYSEGIREALADINELRIRFEFTGKDKTLHTFRALGGEISGKEIWIRFPNVIERIQRREHFRLGVPLGTSLYFETPSAAYEMDIINVSVGGAFGVFGNLKMGTQEDVGLEAGQILDDLQLEFPSKEGDLRVHVKKCLIKRMERDPQTKRYRYALQFSHIEKSEEKALVQIIYRFQREFLRTRLPLNR